MNQLQASSVFKQNYYAHAHIVVNQGGSSSGKTTAIMQVLFCLACQQERQIITVVGQDIPNLKAGAVRDAHYIYDNSPQVMMMVKSYNKTDRIFDFHNGSIIEFKSYDNAQDAKSGKRDYLFVNEANGVSWHIYNELALRTRKRIFIDYNPNISFWVHDNLIGNPGVQLIISDHRHNPFLDQGQKDKIESLKDIDYESWRVYARGLTGKLTGLVFKNWFICDEIPPGATLVAVGLDFGYTNDETACINVFKQSGELWVDELFYETGLTNPDVSAKLKNAKVTKASCIIADSAEPKSIEELYRLGWNIKGAKKGPDSVKISIDILKRYKINITRRSINLRNELDRYIWKVDRSNKTLNEPVDTMNHLIDALRYVALNKLKINKLKAGRSRLPYKEVKWQESVLSLMTI